MADTAKTKFSNNLIALAGLITAIGGLLTVLHQTEVISFSRSEKRQTTIDRHENKNDPGPKEELHNDIVPVSNGLTEREPVFKNLSGYWYDEINGGRYHFVHNTSGGLSFKEFSWMNGVWITTAEGSGKVHGQMINLTYATAYGLSGAFEGTIDYEEEEVAGFALDHNAGVRTSRHLSKE